MGFERRAFRTVPEILTAGCVASDQGEMVRFPNEIASKRLLDAPG